ncbi:MAG: nucleotidyl transferase AbiEii/AbiGii toxin family protein [Planctomycetes bacterium]|nr:nucleotidyl transferase AbiEii/AbiGii toxin family protein [Planctomycetota bacterium]
MPSAPVLQSLVEQSSAWSKGLTAHMLQPEEVARVLSSARVRFVLTGAHATNAWTRRVRATMDVDVVIASRDHRKAVRAVQQAFPHLKARDTEVVTRFLDAKADQVVIDLMKPRDRLLKVLFKEEHVRWIRLGGERVAIPDLETAAALKFAAMVSPNRARTDKMQDAVDFARIVEANARLSLARLAHLAERVYRGGGEEARRLVSAIRKGEPLVF